MVVESEWLLPIIDLTRCDGCAICVAVCPTQAVALRNGKAAIVRPDACVYDGHCEDHCPAGAIGLPYIIVEDK